MPPRFRFPSDDVELWAAIKDNMAGMPRDGRFMAVVGRSKPSFARRRAGRWVAERTQETTASIVVLTTGAAAAYIPARRASSVDPLMVIKGE